MKRHPVECCAGGEKTCVRRERGARFGRIRLVDVYAIVVGAADKAGTAHEILTGDAG